MLEAEEGSRIGIDPKLISVSKSPTAHLYREDVLIRPGLVQSIDSRLGPRSTKLIAIDSNLVDRVHDLGQRSLGLNPYPLSLSGEGTLSKLSRIRGALSSTAISADWIYALPTLPAIAWLLNYRCQSDVPFWPVAYAYLVPSPTQCAIFVDERKVRNADLRRRWDEEGIEVRAYGVQEVGNFVKGCLAVVREKQGEKARAVVLAPQECSCAMSLACSPVGDLHGNCTAFG